MKQFDGHVSGDRQLGDRPRGRQRRGRHGRSRIRYADHRQYQPVRAAPVRLKARQPMNSKRLVCGIAARIWNAACNCVLPCESSIAAAATSASCFCDNCGAQVDIVFVSQMPARREFGFQLLHRRPARSSDARWPSRSTRPLERRRPARRSTAPPEDCSARKRRCRRRVCRRRRVNRRFPEPSCGGERSAGRVLDAPRRRRRERAV